MRKFKYTLNVREESAMRQLETIREMAYLTAINAFQYRRIM